MSVTNFNNDSQLYAGDNLENLRQVPDQSVSLIYIDPPF